MKRAISFIVLLFVVPAFAQMPPGKWWKDPGRVRELRLSEEQQRQIEALFVAARDRMIDRRAQVEKTEAALEDAFDADPFDEGRARVAMESREKARSELMMSEMNLQIGIRKILTREQFEKLKVRDRRPQDGFPRPPDAPLPPRAEPGLDRPPRPPIPPGPPGEPQPPPR